MYEGVESLEEMCLMVVADNDWLVRYCDYLTRLPRNVLMKLPYLVSAYGMNLLEENLIIKGFDILWLTQWNYPSSYSLHHRQRQDINIRLHFDDITSSKVFYYNALLHDVADKLHQGVVKYNQACNDALHVYLKMVKARHSIDKTYFNSMVVYYFSKGLSKYATTVVLDSKIANNLLKDLECYQPILSNIKKVKINLIWSGLSYNNKAIFRLLQFMFSKNARGLQIKPKSSVSGKELNELLSLLTELELDCKIVEDEDDLAYRKRRRLEYDFSLSEVAFSKHQILKKDISQKCNNSIQNIVETTSSGLKSRKCVNTNFTVTNTYKGEIDEHSFDYISDSSNNEKEEVVDIYTDIEIPEITHWNNFETCCKRKHLCEAITCLEIYSNFHAKAKDHGAIANLEYFPNLEKLFIHGAIIQMFNLKELLKSIKSNNENLEELHLADMTQFNFKEELLELCRPTCTQHGKKITLKKLNLGYMLFSDDFMLRLFEPEDCLHNREAVHCRDSFLEKEGSPKGQDSFNKVNIDHVITQNHQTCIYSGLNSFSLGKEDSLDHNIHQEMKTNSTSLEEFYLINAGRIASFDWWYLMNVIGTNLKSLTISSHRHGNLELGLPYLDILLQANYITQLCITNCFLDESFSLNLDEFVEASNLETLVWRNNSMGNVGMKKLSHKLKEKKSFKYLKVLDLRGNIFTIDAVRRFTEALQCSHRTFNRLALCGRNVKLADLSAHKFDILFRNHCHIFITKYDFGDLSDHIAEM